MPNQPSAKTTSDDFINRRDVTQLPLEELLAMIAAKREQRIKARLEYEAALRTIATAKAGKFKEKLEKKATQWGKKLDLVDKYLDQLQGIAEEITHLRLLYDDAYNTSLSSPDEDGEEREDDDGEHEGEEHT